MPQGTSKEAPRSPQGSPKTAQRQLEDGIQNDKTKFLTEFPSKLMKLAKIKKHYVFQCFVRLQKPPNGARHFEEGFTKAPRQPRDSLKMVSEVTKRIFEATYRTNLSNLRNATKTLRFPLLLSLQKPPNAARHLEGSPKIASREP